MAAIVTDNTEANLWKSMRESNCPHTRDELILHHRHLVKYLANKFQNKGIPLDDLIQTGIIGLINAVDRYDPDRGIKFSTYASSTIVGEIKRCFRDIGRSIKVSRGWQELCLGCNRIANELGLDLDHPATISLIAQELSIPEEDVLKAIKVDKMSYPNSLSYCELGIPIDEIGLDEQVSLRGRNNDLHTAINKLTKKQRFVVTRIFFHDQTQVQIAKELGSTPTGVSRIKQRALSKLKRTLHECNFY